MRKRVLSLCMALSMCLTLVLPVPTLASEIEGADVVQMLEPPEYNEPADGESPEDADEPANAESPEDANEPADTEGTASDNEPADIETDSGTSEMASLMGEEGYVIRFHVNSPTGNSDDVTGLTAASSNTTAEGFLTSLPTVTLNGYRFRGWYTDYSSYNENHGGYDDGTLVTTDYAFSDDTTVYAHWTKLVTVTWNANKPENATGTVSGLTAATATLEAEEQLGTLPEPVLDGYTFQGWSTESNDYEQHGYVYYQVSDSSYYYEDTTLYAQWFKPAPYTIVLDANKPEGVTAEVEGLTTTSVTTDANGYVMSLPEPSLADCVFNGWRDKNGYSYDKNSQFTKDLTLYADWSRIYTVTLNQNKPEGAKSDMTVSKYWSSEATDNGDGTWSVETGSGGYLSSYYFNNANYSDNTFLSGYRFLGWYDASEAGNQVIAPDTWSLNIESDITLYAHWSEIAYTIVFDVNSPTSNSEDVTGLSARSANTVTGGVLESLPELTVDGYRFRGWYTDSSYDSDYQGYNYGDLVTTEYLFNGDTTVYAHWSRVYSFTLDANKPSNAKADVTGLDETAFMKEYGEPIGTLPTPALEGFEFQGWSSEANDWSDHKSLDYPVTESTQFWDSMTIYAQWEQIAPFEITYDVNKPEDAEAEPEGLTKESDTTDNNGYLVSLPTLTLKNYNFDGWVNPETGNYVSNNTQFFRDTVLQAHWTVDLTHTVTFDFSLPEGAKTEPTARLITNLTDNTDTTDTYGRLPNSSWWYTDDIILPGYRFVGWNTEPNGGGVEVDLSQVFTEDTTLYANWSETSYTILLVLQTPTGNDEDVAGISTKSLNTVTGGVLDALPEPSLPGYRFDYWYTDRYVDGWRDDPVVENETLFKDNENIYGHWTPIYVVTFNANTPSNAKAEVAGLEEATREVVREEAIGALPTPTLEGFEFQGWSYEANDWDDEYLNNPVSGNDSSYSDVEIYAQWKQVAPFEITFNVNKPTGVDAEIEGLTKESDTTDTNGYLISLPTLTLTGYIFEGWFTDPANGNSVSNTTQFVKDTAVYAHWRVDLTHKVTFDFNAPEGARTEPTSRVITELTDNTDTTDGYGHLQNYHYGIHNWYTDDIVLPGYLFVSWSLSDGTAVNLDEYVFTEDTTLYANWSETSYAIVFDVRSPSGNDEDVTGLASKSLNTVTGGVLEELPEVSVNDYAFNGWYYGGEPVVANETLFSHDDTVYAEWLPTYTVTYNVNAPESANSEVSGVQETAATIHDGDTIGNLPTPDLEGFVFIGWSTEPNDPELTHQVSATDTSTVDMTIYAQWRAKQYTVTFTAEDGTVISSEIYDYGTTAENIVKPENPAKESTAQYAYAFAAWSPEIKDVTADATYTATYTESVRQYTVKFVNEDGTELNSASYDYGTTAGNIIKPEKPVKESTAQYAYAFAAWSPEIADVTADATYTATYTQSVRQYTVKFVNEDGTELNSASYDYGTAAENIVKPENPAKESTAQYAYAFAAWSPEIADVTADATYTATYTESVRQYTVKFVNEDGTELNSASYDYGTTVGNIVKPENPTKESTAQYAYAFAAWSPEIADVTADATYTATYTESVRQYTVKFVNEDGTELNSASYDYGTTAGNIVKPENPTKESTAQYTYQFSGWTPEIADVTADATYTATYTENVRQRIIIWLNSDGSELDRATYQAEQNEPTTDKIPVKAPDENYVYAFSSWESVGVEGNVKTYSPVFTPTLKTDYTIIWLNGDGSELDRATYREGQKEPVTDKSPTKMTDEDYVYTFSGWDSGVTDGYVKTYSPTFTSTLKTDYTVIWLNGDGSELDRASYQAGEDEPVTSKTPVKVEDAEYSYTFSGWDSGVQEGNVKTYKPNFTATAKEQVSRTVTFDSNGGKGEMESLVIRDGSTITLPANGFTPPNNQRFKAWRIGDVEYKSGDLFTVTDNITVSAQWTNQSRTQGCYVATSVYGSYDCPEVWTLRRFRDNVLAKTWYGRLFIRLYYAVSPTAVKLFGNSEWFQNFFRDRLDKMVSGLQADGFESTPYQDRAW